MANSWLRLYHDMPNDPKWRTIAKASKQTIPVVLGVYVHLLTIASGAVDRGTVVNVNSEDLASALDIDSASVDAVLEAMQGRVLDGEKLSGWEKRQYEREDGAAERAKAWREKKKQEREAERKRTQTNAANGSRTQTNVSERKRTPDKKREEEIKKEQEPSRDKREVDFRHSQFKSEIERYMAEKKVLFIWDGSDAAQLSLLLKATPGLTIADFQRCLFHRARSPGTPHGERPRAWLPNVLKYQEAPLNEFGKTGGSNGTFKGKTEHSVDAGLRAIQEIEDRAAADRAGSAAAGEAGHSGLSTLRLGPGDVRPEGHRAGSECFEIEAATGR